MILGNNVDREFHQSVLREVKELVNVFTTIESLGNRFPEAESVEVPDVLPRLQSFETQFRTSLTLEGLRRLKWLILFLGVPLGLPPWVPFMAFVLEKILIIVKEVHNITLKFKTFLPRK